MREISDSIFLDENTFQITQIDGSTVIISRDHQGETWITFDGFTYRLSLDEIRSPNFQDRKSNFGSVENSNNNQSKQVTSPFTGRISKIHVKIGDKVSKGTPLFSVESMKMEINCDAPHSGTVIAIHGRPGESIQRNAIVILIDERLVNKIM